MKTNEYKVNFNGNTHIVGKVYDLTQENMCAMLAYIEYLSKVNRIYQEEEACCRLELEDLRQMLEGAQK